MNKVEKNQIGTELIRTDQNRLEQNRSDQIRRKIFLKCNSFQSFDLNLRHEKTSKTLV